MISNQQLLLRGLIKLFIRWFSIVWAIRSAGRSRISKGEHTTRPAGCVSTRSSGVLRLSLAFPVPRVAVHDNIHIQSHSGPSIQTITPLLARCLLPLDASRSLILPCLQQQGKLTLFLYSGRAELLEEKGYF